LVAGCHLRNLLNDGGKVLEAAVFLISTSIQSHLCVTQQHPTSYCIGLYYPNSSNPSSKNVFIQNHKRHIMFQKSSKFNFISQLSYRALSRRRSRIFKSAGVGSRRRLHLHSDVDFINLRVRSDLLSGRRIEVSVHLD
jgi:hypothetical protein